MTLSQGEKLYRFDLLSHDRKDGHHRTRLYGIVIATSEESAEKITREYFLPKVGEKMEIRIDEPDYDPTQQLFLAGGIYIN